MVPLLSLLLVAQVEIPVEASPRDTVPGAPCVPVDSTSAQPFHCRASRARVSESLLASAFDDPAARALFERARAARVEQDSALASYEAIARQRISVGLSLTQLGRKRLLFRHENASRVRWHRDRGAIVDVLGSRSVIPILAGVQEERTEVDVHTGSPIPYYPGRESLWLGYDLVKADAVGEGLVHPIADGAEAYYQYASGDSASIRLPDGRRIRLVELRIRARRPQWDLIVGSFWFDAGSAQLVRAAYRMAVPLDAWTIIEEEEEDEDIPAWVRPMITPMTGQISAVTIEHGLYEGRFWLPRTQAAMGEARAGFMRVPFSLEETFRYESVNAGLDALRLTALSDGEDAPPPEEAPARGKSAVLTRGGDTTVYTEYERHASRRRQCDTSDVMVREQRRYQATLRVLVRVPCDSMLLANSPELPPSIYERGEEVFGSADRDELIKSLNLSTQPSWSPQRPELLYGLEHSLVRYNRVEGLSAGIGARQVLGRGYTAEALGQLGVADLQPNGEIRVTRSDGRRIIGVAVFRRLSTANDWGRPLSAGNSVNALLFGRDEGFYYRTWGAELTGAGTHGSYLSWRLFAERHGAAAAETHFSLANALNGVRFEENIEAARGTVAGAGARWTGSHGLDPRGFRLFADARAEGGVGDFSYTRGAVDLTLTHALAWRVDGSLTLGGGSSTGDVPPQRLWYLGGAHTIRGQRAVPGDVSDPGVGNAYWMARAEVGTSWVAARPVLFYDVGWAGDRAHIGQPGRLMSGAGIGASFLDGALRLDAAYGFWPRRGVRLELYLEGKL